MLVAVVELVAVLQHHRLLAEAPQAGALDARPDAVRREQPRRLGRAQVMVVVARNDGELGALGKLRQRLEGDRVAFVHGGQQRGQRAAGRRLPGDPELLEKRLQPLGRRLHGGEVEAVAEQDQLRPVVAGDAVAQLRQLAPLAVVGEEPGLGALVEMEVAHRVNGHPGDGPQPRTKNKRQRRGGVR